MSPYLDKVPYPCPGVIPDSCYAEQVSLLTPAPDRLALLGECGRALTRILRGEDGA
jgi:hypothetical protein